MPAPQIDPDERAVDLAWAAGLFAGEGYCAAIRRGGHLTVYLGVSMLDARSIERFATIFGRRRVSFPYHRDRSREVHRVVATGRPAEEILSLMWPHLVGTDKADQVRRACEEVGTFAWVDGTATTRRPTRLGGNQWAGRRHSDATIQKMSEARRKWWADKRAREADDG